MDFCAIEILILLLLLYQINSAIAREKIKKKLITSKMILQYRWQITGTFHSDGVQEKCHEGDSWSDSLESCRDEAQLHYDTEIFSQYMHLETVISTRPHPDIAKEQMRMIDRKLTLKHELLICYAEALVAIIFEQIVKELCYGCSVDHPSQTHHDVCLMMERKEQITLCLAIAEQRLNHENVIAKWIQRTKHMVEPPLNGMDILKYSSEEFDPRDKKTLELLVRIISSH